MAGEKSQSPTYLGKVAEHTQGPLAITVNLIKTIQTIEAFVKNTSWPEKAKDIWKYMKKTTFSKADQDISNISKDIQKFKS